MPKLSEAQQRRYILDEVLEASSRVGAHVLELAPSEVDALRSRLASRFGPGPSFLLTFDNMLDKVAVQSPEGWRSFDQFLDDKCCTMFWDAPGDLDRAGIRIPNGRDVVGILSESFCFPFYLVDESERFVLGENDSGYVIGVGLARAFVNSLRG